jgi:hypothetical protein
MVKVLPLNRMAAQVRLPAAWLKREALAGQIPCLVVGRRMLFNPAAVETALAELAANTREVQHA